jgi:hypothetical protein
MAKYLEIVECHETVSLGSATPRKVSSVVDMYSYYLKEQKPEFFGIGKIVLIYSDKDDLFSDGSVVQITCNLKDNLEDNEWRSERRKYLNIFHEKLTDYILTEGGDVAKFNEAYERVRSKNFVFDEIWKTKKWNSSRNAMAKIEWRFTDKIEIYFLILLKDGNQKRYFISSLSPGIGVLDFCLGSIKWIDNNNVILLQSNKRDYWKLDLINEEVVFYYCRAESGDPHGQYDLGMMYANGNSFIQKDVRESLYWLNEAAEKGYGRAINQLKRMDVAQ